MSLEESFRDKKFHVEDPDARLRQETDLQTFETFGADEARPAGAKDAFKRLAQGAEVLVDAVRMEPSGSETTRIFARTTDLDGKPLGWTSTLNFKGRFVNETLGVARPGPGATRFGPNAAWAAGAFLRQVDLVLIVNKELRVRQLAMDTVAAYFDLVKAAAADGIAIRLNSGFRSWPEQKFFHDGFKKGLPGFNRAAPPGASKHQNGIAFDIDVAGGDGNPTYDRLKTKGPRFGFFRSVSGEPWHWEHDVTQATKLAEAGTFKTGNVVV